MILCVIVDKKFKVNYNVIKLLFNMYKNNKTAALKYLENDVLITKAVAEKML